MDATAEASTFSYNNKSPTSSDQNQPEYYSNIEIQNIHITYSASSSTHTNNNSYRQIILTLIHYIKLLLCISCVAEDFKTVSSICYIS